MDCTYEGCVVTSLSPALHAVEQSLLDEGKGNSARATRDQADGGRLRRQATSFCLGAFVPQIDTKVPGLDADYHPTSRGLLAQCGFEPAFRARKPSPRLVFVSPSILDARRKTTRSTTAARITAATERPAAAVGRLDL
jgi:hypothetical protein